MRDSFAASESVELAPNGGGRIASEQVAGLRRNQWPDWLGLRSCARCGGVRRHLDGALTGPFQARSAGHQGAAETAEAQIADTQSEQCEGAGSVCAERQLQRRSLRSTLMAKPDGASRGVPEGPRVVPVLTSQHPPAFWSLHETARLFWHDVCHPEHEMATARQHR